MPEITEIKPETSASSFLRAARAGNLERVLEFIKGIAGHGGAIDINISNANGLNALHLASKEGHAQVVDELVKRGANVNAATKKGNTALHIASLAGQSKIVELLVNNGADANAQSQNGFTPLYMAAQENHDGVVKYLVDHGANQTITTEDGFTPLAVALQQGHNKVVSVLLENDSRSGKVRLPALHVAAKKDDCKAADLLLQTETNPDVTSKSGFTPLHIAAHYGNEAIAQILVNHGSDVNFKARHDITPLHVSSRWGKVTMVTILLNNGAVIDAKTRDGLTPLHCAARSGHADVVELLLSRGADISAKTKNELTPLHMAAQGDHLDCAKILLQNQAPVDDVTVDYLTSLHICAHYGNVGTAKLLLDSKAEVDARALNGFTPLHIACKKNRIKVIELLLKRGASIGCTTESGLTPLHVASFMGHMNIVIYLLKHGAETDAPTVRGETPLHLAARANQTDIMRIILRNGAKVDARARENQTPLHVAARLGNTDTVMLLLQHGADVGAKTTDDYTPLHLAAKEGHSEALAALLDHAPAAQLPILLTSLSTKGFSPIHLSAKCGSVEVTKLLLERGTPVDVLGKNDVTPLHVASHYDHPAVVNLLLEKGASPAAKANNGYTPLHIAAKKNQMDVAPLLLDHGADPNSLSRSGFTPVHLAAQGGFEDMTSLLLDFKGNPNASSNNGLTPLHLAAQNDHVPAASILITHGTDVNATTTGGYTPLHTACHFGRLNMVRLLLDHGAKVGAKTSSGYTALHQAAQQGHSAVVSLLLQNKASPESLTNQGQTALSIAQQLGYVSVIETLKVVTETIVTTTTTTTVEEKYKVLAPETMQETFMSDSEDDEAEMEKSLKAEYIPSYLSSRFDGTLKDLPGDDTLLGDHSYKYLTSEQMKSLGDDSVRMLDQDPSARLSIMERSHGGKSDYSPDYDKYQEDLISPTQLIKREEARGKEAFVEHPGVVRVDNVPTQKPPVHLGFLVSFMVDARGGAMRGCRHSGVRVIIPPRKAPGPLRVTCRFVKKEKMANPPPLMEGEGLACRVLELGPAGTKFLGPVIIEIPHFASLRGNEREITILRSDNGETWREHVLEASETAVQEVLNESFDGEDALDDLHTTRITRILTNDFPLYFAIVSRIHQETHTIGPEGGIISSTIVPMVQAMFPEGALTKRIRIGLQAHPISRDMVSKMLGNRVAVSPVVTIEPRRRKFHKPITLTIPLPQASTKGMINQYNNSNEAPPGTLRLLCSITGGTTPAQWEDITGSTPLTFVNNYVSFTTTVSARFWLMDCRQVNDATKFATEVFREASHVPYMVRMLVYAKRRDQNEALMRAFTVTDDKMEKTLEEQEHFTEVAQSRDVEVLDNKLQYVEMVGNLVTVTKTDQGQHLADATPSKGELFPSSSESTIHGASSTPLATGEVLTVVQPSEFTPTSGLATKFRPFQENRLAFRVRIKDPHQEPIGRLLFLREARRTTGSGEPSPPICTLNVVLPNEIMPDCMDVTAAEQNGSAWSKSFLNDLGIGREMILAPDQMIDQLARPLREDWVRLARQLNFADHEIEDIQREFPQNVNHQAKVMLVAWKRKGQHQPEHQSHEAMERALRNINREDVIQHCPWSSITAATPATGKIGGARTLNGILPSSTPSALTDRVVSHKDAPAFTDHTLDDSLDHYEYDEYREGGHGSSSNDGKRRAPRELGDNITSPHDESNPSSPEAPQQLKKESPVTPVVVKSRMAPQSAAERSHPEKIAMLQKLVADSDDDQLDSRRPNLAAQRGEVGVNKGEEKMIPEPLLKPMSDLTPLGANGPHDYGDQSPSLHQSPLPTSTQHRGSNLEPRDPIVLDDEPRLSITESNKTVKKGSVVKGENGANALIRAGLEEREIFDDRATTALAAGKFMGEDILKSAEREAVNQEVIERPEPAKERRSSSISKSIKKLVDDIGDKLRPENVITPRPEEDHHINPKMERAETSPVKTISRSHHSAAPYIHQLQGEARYKTADQTPVSGGGSGLVHYHESDYTRTQEPEVVVTSRLPPILYSTTKNLSDSDGHAPQSPRVAVTGPRPHVEGISHLAGTGDQHPLHPHHHEGILEGVAHSLRHNFEDRGQVMNHMYGRDAEKRAQVEENIAHLESSTGHSAEDDMKDLKGKFDKILHSAHHWSHDASTPVVKSLRDVDSKIKHAFDHVEEPSDEKATQSLRKSLEHIGHIIAHPTEKHRHKGEAEHIPDDVEREHSDGRNVLDKATRSIRKSIENIAHKVTLPTHKHLDETAKIKHSPDDVEAHSGDIKVQSFENIGTKMTHPSENAEQIRDIKTPVVTAAGTGVPKAIDQYGDELSGSIKEALVEAECKAQPLLAKQEGIIETKGDGQNVFEKASNTIRKSIGEIGTKLKAVGLHEPHALKSKESHEQLADKASPTFDMPHQGEEPNALREVGDKMAHSLTQFGHDISVSAHHVVDKIEDKLKMTREKGSDKMDQAALTSSSDGEKKSKNIFEKASHSIRKSIDNVGDKIDKFKLKHPPKDPDNPLEGDLTQEETSSDLDSSPKDGPPHLVQHEKGEGKHGKNLFDKAGRSIRKSLGELGHKIKQPAAHKEVDTEGLKPAVGLGLEKVSTSIHKMVDSVEDELSGFVPGLLHHDATYLQQEPQAQPATSSQEILDKEKGELVKEDLNSPRIDGRFDMPHSTESHLGSGGILGEAKHLMTQAGHDIKQAVEGVESRGKEKARAVRSSIENLAEKFHISPSGHDRGAPNFPEDKVKFSHDTPIMHPHVSASSPITESAPEGQSLGFFDKTAHAVSQVGHTLTENIDKAIVTLEEKIHQASSDQAGKTKNGAFDKAKHSLRKSLENVGEKLNIKPAHGQSKEPDFETRVPETHLNLLSEREREKAAGPLSEVQRKAENILDKTEAARRELASDMERDITKIEEAASHSVQRSLDEIKAKMGGSASPIEPQQEPSSHQQQHKRVSGPGKILAATRKSITKAMVELGSKKESSPTTDETSGGEDGKKHRSSSIVKSFKKMIGSTPSPSSDLSPASAPDQEPVELTRALPLDKSPRPRREPVDYEASGAVKVNEPNVQVTKLPSKIPKPSDIIRLSEDEKVEMLGQVLKDTDSVPNIADLTGETPTQDSDDLGKTLVTETTIVSHDKKSQGPVPTQEIIVEPEEPKTPRSSPEPKKGQAPFTALDSPHDIKTLSEDIQSRLQLKPQIEDENPEPTTLNHEDHTGTVLKSSHFHAATPSDRGSDVTVILREEEFTPYPTRILITKRDSFSHEESYFSEIRESEERSPIKTRTEGAEEEEETYQQLSVREKIKEIEQRNSSTVRPLRVGHASAQPTPGPPKVDVRRSYQEESGAPEFGLSSIMTKSTPNPVKSYDHFASQTPVDKSSKDVREIIEEAEPKGLDRFTEVGVASMVTKPQSLVKSQSPIKHVTTTHYEVAGGDEKAKSTKIVSDEEDLRFKHSRVTDKAKDEASQESGDEWVILDGEPSDDVPHGQPSGDYSPQKISPQIDNSSPTAPAAVKSVESTTEKATSFFHQTTSKIYKSLFGQEEAPPTPPPHKEELFPEKVNHDIVSSDAVEDDIFQSPPGSVSPTESENERIIRYEEEEVITRKTPTGEILVDRRRLTPTEVELEKTAQHYHVKLIHESSEPEDEESQRGGSKAGSRPGSSFSTTSRPLSAASGMAYYQKEEDRLSESPKPKIHAQESSLCLGEANKDLPTTPTRVEPVVEDEPLSPVLSKYQHKLDLLMSDPFPRDLADQLSTESCDVINFETTDPLEPQNLQDRLNGQIYWSLDRILRAVPHKFKSHFLEPIDRSVSTTVDAAVVDCILLDRGFVEELAEEIKYFIVGNYTVRFREDVGNRILSKADLLSLVGRRDNSEVHKTGGQPVNPTYTTLENSIGRGVVDIFEERALEVIDMLESGFGATLPCDRGEEDELIVDSHHQEKDAKVDEMYKEGMISGARKDSFDSGPLPLESDTKSEKSLVQRSLPVELEDVTLKEEILLKCSAPQMKSVFMGEKETSNDSVSHITTMERETIKMVSSAQQVFSPIKGILKSPAPFIASAEEVEKDIPRSALPIESSEREKIIYKTPSSDRISVKIEEEVVSKAVIPAQTSVEIEERGPSKSASPQIYALPTFYLDAYPPQPQIFAPEFFAKETDEWFLSKTPSPSGSSSPGSFTSGKIDTTPAVKFLADLAFKDASTLLNSLSRPKPSLSDGAYDSKFPSPSPPEPLDLDAFPPQPLNFGPKFFDSVLASPPPSNVSSPGSRSVISSNGGSGGSWDLDNDGAASSTLSQIVQRVSREALNKALEVVEEHDTAQLKSSREKLSERLVTRYSTTTTSSVPPKSAASLKLYAGHDRRETDYDSDDTNINLTAWEQIEGSDLERSPLTSAHPGPNVEKFGRYLSGTAMARALETLDYSPDEECKRRYLTRSALNTPTTPLSREGQNFSMPENRKLIDLQTPILSDVKKDDIVALKSPITHDAAMDSSDVGSPSAITPKEIGTDQPAPLHLATSQLLITSLTSSNNDSSGGESFDFLRKNNDDSLACDETGDYETADSVRTRDFASAVSGGLTGGGDTSSFYTCVSGGGGPLSQEDALSCSTTARASPMPSLPEEKAPYLPPPQSNREGNVTTTTTTTTRLPPTVSDNLYSYGPTSGTASQDEETSSAFDNYYSNEDESFVEEGMEGSLDILSSWEEESSGSDRLRDNQATPRQQMLITRPMSRTGYRESSSFGERRPSSPLPPILTMDDCKASASTYEEDREATPLAGFRILPVAATDLVGDTPSNRENPLSDGEGDKKIEEVVPVVVPISPATTTKTFVNSSNGDDISLQRFRELESIIMAQGGNSDTPPSVSPLVEVTETGCEETNEEMRLSAYSTDHTDSGGSSSYEKDDFVWLSKPEPVIQTKSMDQSDITIISPPVMDCESLEAIIESTSKKVEAFVTEYDLINSNLERRSMDDLDIEGATGRNAKSLNDDTLFQGSNDSGKGGERKKMLSSLTSLNAKLYSSPARPSKFPSPKTSRSVRKQRMSPHRQSKPFTGPKTAFSVTTAKSVFNAKQKPSPPKESTKRLTHTGIPKRSNKVVTEESSSESHVAEKGRLRSRDNFSNSKKTLSSANHVVVGKTVSTTTTGQTRSHGKSSSSSKQQQIVLSEQKTTLGKKMSSTSSSKVVVSQTPVKSSKIPSAPPSTLSSSNGRARSKPADPSSSTTTTARSSVVESSGGEQQRLLPWVYGSHDSNHAAAPSIFANEPYAPVTRIFTGHDLPVRKRKLSSQPGPDIITGALPLPQDEPKAEAMAGTLSAVPATTAGEPIFLTEDRHFFACSPPPETLNQDTTIATTASLSNTFHSSNLSSSSTAASKLKSFTTTPTLPSSNTSEDHQHSESQHEREGESVLKRLKIMKSTKSRTIIKDGKEETETFEETLYDDGRGYPIPFEDLDPELKEKISQFLKEEPSEDHKTIIGKGDAPK